MNVLTDTWRGLVRRRLWPLALLLIAALAAVPLLLSKSSAPAPAPAVAAAAPAGTALVSAAEDPQGGRRRYVLGARKDPFEPAPLPKVKHRHRQTTATAPQPVAAPTPAPKTDAAPASPAPSGAEITTAPPAVSPPTVAPAPKVAKSSVPEDSLSIRFGATSGSPAARTLERGYPLPSAGHPLLVYLHLEDGGKTAVFMVGSEVKGLDGDGRCDPDPESCATLRLKAGETEFIDVQGAQYELDVEKIHAAS
jgi:hypothetical protein